MSENPSLDARASTLNKRMKETAGARFNASRRLNLKVKTFNIIVVVISCCILTLTILPYILKTNQNITDILNFFTIASAIFMIGASVFQNSSLNSVNSEQHHRSALEINEIRRFLEISPTVKIEEDLQKFTEMYNNVLQKYSINHDDIDHQKFMAERPEQYPHLSKIERNWIKCKVLFGNYLSLIILFFGVMSMIWSILIILQ